MTSKIENFARTLRMSQWITTQNYKKKIPAFNMYKFIFFLFNYLFNSLIYHLDVLLYTLINNYNIIGDKTKIYGIYREHKRVCFKQIALTTVQYGMVPMRNTLQVKT